MSDRTVLRLGSLALISGAVLALVGNILHPRLSDYSDPVNELLAEVAASDGWIAVHLVILLATLLIGFGLFAFARSMKGGPGEGTARVALGSLLISLPVAVVTLLLDGYATKAVAASGGPAGEAVAHIAWAAFMGMVIMFLGITPALFGAAAVADGGYPAWLGWFAQLFGVISVGAGVYGVYEGASSAFFMVFSASSGLLTLWILVLGFLLRARVAAPEPAAARA